jgi:hypothetical protein
MKILEVKMNSKNIKRRTTLNDFTYERAGGR